MDSRSEKPADAAQPEGDYKTAIPAAPEALQLDESNSKGIVLVSLLTKEAEEAGKRADVKTLLEVARRELSLRRYKEAIEVLRKAEQADAANPEIPILLEDANFGLEQIKRRELIARLETEVLAAASLEELERCARSIQEAMASLPTDTTLIRLNAQVDRQIRGQENRRFVEETIQACRDLRPKEALKVVQEARQRVPGEERLQGLEKLLSDRVKRQTEEERREEFVSQAREALAGGKFADAVRILEGCQAEGIATDEILSLLKFARREEEEHRSQALTRSRVAQAQALIGESAYEEAIAFLESALKESDDKAMRFVHEQAMEGRASLSKQVEAELANAGKLAREGKQAEAIEYLEALPPALKRSKRVRAAESALREERQGAIFRTIGRAYSELETGLPAGEQTMQRAAAALGDSTLAGSVAETFRGRMRAFADRACVDLTGKYKIMMDSGDRTGAAELAKQVAAIVDYAGPEAKSAWESLAPRPRKIRTPARLSR